MPPPRVPVITSEGITYDFVSIAQSMLREGDVAKRDPSTGRAIKFLVYNRAIKDANEALLRSEERLDEVATLSIEEKKEIAVLYQRLTRRYPSLKINGILELEGMRALIYPPRPKPMPPVGALVDAARNGDLVAVRGLLADSRVDPNQAMTDGATPLLTAVLCGHLDVARAILLHQNGTPTDNPLSIAAQKGYLPLVRALLLDTEMQQYYLNQIILKPELMRYAFTKNTAFFKELANHRDALWSMLKDEPGSFGLTSDAYQALLTAILASREEPNKALRHPLYSLFETPWSDTSLFRKPTNNPIFSSIQAHLDGLLPPSQDLR